MDYQKMWYQVKKDLSINVNYGDEDKRETNKQLLVKMTSMECDAVLESEEN